MRDHSDCKRQFTYSRGNPDGEVLDKIAIGFYSKKGGTTREFSIQWINLLGTKTPRLCAYDDSWDALWNFRDLLEKMADFDDESPTPDEMCKVLLSCGIEDATPGVQPSEKSDDNPEIEALGRAWNRKFKEGHSIDCANRMIYNHGNCICDIGVKKVNVVNYEEKKETDKKETESQGMDYFINPSPPAEKRFTDLKTIVKNNKEVNIGSLNLRPVVVTRGSWKGQRGFFHSWDTGSDSHETRAIIEFDDKCGLVPIEWVQFTDR